MAKSRFYDTFAPIFGTPVPTPAARKPAPVRLEPDLFGHPPADYATRERLAYGFHREVFDACLKEIGIRLATCRGEVGEQDRTEVVRIMAEVGTVAQANGICAVSPVVTHETEYSFTAGGRDERGNPCLFLATPFFDPRSELFPYLAEALFAEMACARSRDEPLDPERRAQALRLRRMLFEEHYGPDGASLLRQPLQRLVKEALARPGHPPPTPGAAPVPAPFSLNAVDAVDFAQGVVEHTLLALAKLNPTKEIGGPIYGLLQAEGRRLTVSHALTSYQFVAGDGTLRFTKAGWEDIQRQRRLMDKEARFKGLLQVGWWRSYPESWGEVHRGVYSYSDMAVLGQLGNMLGLLVNPRAGGDEVYLFDGRFHPRFPGTEDGFYQAPWRGNLITGKTSIDLGEEAVRALNLNPPLRQPLALLQERLAELEAKRRRVESAQELPRPASAGDPTTDYVAVAESLAESFLRHLDRPSVFSLYELLRRGSLHELISARVPEELHERIADFLRGAAGKDPAVLKHALMRRIKELLG